MKKYNNIKDKFNIPNTKSLLCVESPYGGDEINNIIYGQNYGYPISAYGENYKFRNRIPLFL